MTSIEMERCLQSFSNSKNAREAHYGDARKSHDFDKLFTKARPHIFEKICLSLDYESFKNCFEINKAWKHVLTSRTFQGKAKSAFQLEILEDEMELRMISGQGNTEEVRKLLSIGLVDVDSADRYGWTPLLKAAVNGHKYVVELLLNGGSDPNKANEMGTPLHLAVEHDHSDVVQVLLDGGADPNKKNKWGRTPLHEAAFNNHKDVVQLLLDREADPNKANFFGETILHVASMWGHKDVVQLLLDGGADPNNVNKWVETPLHEAARNCHKEVFQLLLERGADPNMANREGQTPLQLAEEMSSEEEG